MENTQEKRIYYYKIKEDGSILLLRCFGESPRVLVPETIAGRPVTQIGPYCFAANSHLTGSYEVAAENCSPAGISGLAEIPELGKAGTAYSAEVQSPAPITEQAGRFLSSLFLPDTITQVDAYACYGCRQLTEISFGPGIRILENDAFMNCTRLSTLIMRASVTEVTALRSILAQISWNIEVHFTGEPEGCFFFPEYQEYYDEVGPVHIFELQLEGEGFRARKSFDKECFQPVEYDTIFPKASVEEKEEIACRIALDRILFPAYLTEENKSMYMAFLKKHGKKAADLLISAEIEEDRIIGNLDRLFADHIFEADTFNYLLEKTSTMEKAQLSAALIGMKRRYLAPKKKDRFAFDDF